MKFLNKKKKGAMSLQFLILCMIGVVLFIIVFTEFQHQMIVRNIEAAADLAAVEALRAQIDEDSIRDEKLEVKYENLNTLREQFLKKIISSIPDRTFNVIGVEIPTVDSNGNVITTDWVNLDDDISTFNLPNSSVAQFQGPFAVTDPSGALQDEYYVGGTGTSNAAMSIVKVTGVNETTNKGASGTKPKQSYVLTSKVTIFFSTTSMLNKVNALLLNYYDFLSNQKSSVTTTQVSKDVMAVTIQAVGEVVLR